MMKGIFKDGEIKEGENPLNPDFEDIIYNLENYTSNNAPDELMQVFKLEFINDNFKIISNPLLPKDTVIVSTEIYKALLNYFNNKRKEDR